MNTILKQILILFVASVVVFGGIVLAGSLTPSTETPESTYVSLNNIYEKLTTGATTTEKSFAPIVGTDTPTMYTMSEIFEAIPEWLTFSDATTTITAGYYEETDLATVDTDLIADNIAEGVTIFGVDGIAIVGSELAWDVENGPDSNWYDADTYCLSKGGTWRLPHVWELSRNSYDANPINLNDGMYWTDESTIPDSAYRVTVSDSTYTELNVTLKLVSMSFRCIRG